MEPPDMRDTSANQPIEEINPPPNVLSPARSRGPTLLPQAEAGASLPDGTVSGARPPGAVMATSSYVYALGRVEPRFPRLAVEKEFTQATGRAETAGLTDRQALHAVLSQRQNRYLAR